MTFFRFLPEDFTRILIFLQGVLSFNGLQEWGMLPSMCFTRNWLSQNCSSSTIMPKTVESIGHGNRRPLMPLKSQSISCSCVPYGWEATHQCIPRDKVVHARNPSTGLPATWEHLDKVYDRAERPLNMPLLGKLGSFLNLLTSNWRKIGGHWNFLVEVNPRPSGLLLRHHTWGESNSWEAPSRPTRKGGY